MSYTFVLGIYVRAVKILFSHSDGHITIKAASKTLKKNKKNLKCSYLKPTPPCDVISVFLP